MKNIDRLIFVVLVVLIVIFGRQLLQSYSAPSSETETSTGNVQRVFENFNPGNFDNPTNIDNAWLPLKPGTKWVYEGFTVEDDESIPHRIEFTVTDLTKEIEGVTTRVVYVVDFSDDAIVEKEVAFYAQDNDGNVWFFGEYPEEYENGEFVDAPTWIAGQKDARPGIKMWAEPKMGTPPYFQGWGPEVGWNDYGQVDQTAQETCVPVDCYKEALVIAESSLDEENAFQLKYYVRDVGNVAVGWRGDEEQQEELELVVINKLNPVELAEIRLEALKLESSAYENSPDVYAHTSPAQ